MVAGGDKDFCAILAFENCLTADLWSIKSVLLYYYYYDYKNYYAIAEF